MIDFFRVVRGIELDETVRILQGANAPGHTADTDSANVGSVYTDNVSGTLYTKKIAGAGPSAWIATGTGGSGSSALYGEYAASPSSPNALGTNSIALGSGAQTDTGASNSLAIGDQSLTRLFGSVAQASGRFGSMGDAQSCRYVLRTHTVNNLPTEVFLDGTDGSARLLMPDNSTWIYKVTIVGHRTDIADGHAGYTIEGVAFRGNGVGTVSLLGKPSKTILAESNIPWDANIAADTTYGSLSITATGQVGKTIRWVVLVETVEVTN